ncbi:MAG: hypothetical protein HN353_05590 [Bdellovibrionales bacterium]|jgi:hypothetical protein|nr:hypothetical protein [Bdellovibrionales bacterium]MBT3525085.1 hypothetical protein [Bdellovibrionales bacterium]MBT7669775.1 hypothetical protein [Bdellovibrionales bacterium]MBT7767394.1 hypothetical protein [Bdellovibrionales bacterium]
MMDKRSFYFVGGMLVALLILAAFNYMAHHSPIHLKQTHVTTHGRRHQTLHPAGAPPPKEVVKVKMAVGQVAATATPSNRYISGGQHICSRCSHTGLPKFDRNHSPICSVCGGFMQVIRISSAKADKVCAQFKCPQLATGGPLK